MTDRCRGWKAALLATAVFAAPAQAETLADALAKAYRLNPTLTGARASQRALDEDIVLNKVNGRPSANLTGTYSEQVQRPETLLALQTQPIRSAQAQAQVSVPLYNGGAIRNAIDAAELRSEAGRDTLRGTEAALFSRVVAAYMDVIRDSQIVLLNTQNVRALDVNLRASRDRFEVGDLTRTDVAQSDSRLALARATLEQAEATLIASKERYTQFVGTPPEMLSFPVALPGLPDSSDAAVGVALSDNPDIRASLKSREAVRHDVKVARAQVSPRLAAVASGAYNSYLGTADPNILPGSTRSAAIGASLTLPLYQGGRPAAQERQATARESAAIERAVEIERDVIAQVRSAYAAWRASLRRIDSTRVAVRASDLSLQGVKAENSVGSRTILDILNAEQEALNARVQMVTSERDAFVAAFTLIAAMGHAEARDLGLDTVLYDPANNYDRVRGKVLDFDFDPKATAVSVTTAGTAAQSATPIVTDMPTPNMPGQPQGQ